MADERDRRDRRDADADADAEAEKYFARRDVFLPEAVRRMLERQRSHFRDHDGSTSDDTKEKPYE